MVNSRLKDNAFSVKDNANPYEGDLGKGIAYDDFESKVLTIYQDELDFPLALNTYRTAAKRLIKYLSTKPRQRVLDVGSGTGISTLELLMQNPEISVTGIEISEGMSLISKYKFNQESEEALKVVSQVKDQLLTDYWINFREESRPYKDKVDFIKDDIQTTTLIEPLSLDHVVGNQSFHWTDLTKTFQQINKFLRNNGTVIFNSSSHFYRDSVFTNEEYDFRLNDLFKYVVNEVSKKVRIKTDYYNLSKPKHNLHTFKEIALQAGFNLEQIATHLVQFDLSVLIQNHIPATIRQLNDSHLEKDELDQITKSAIFEVLRNPKSMNDIKHRYAINTTFRMVKIN